MYQHKPFKEGLRLAFYDKTISSNSMTEQYNKEGYFLTESFICETEIAKISAVVDRFHDSWINANQKFYQQKAINSAYLTGKEHLREPDRRLLFDLISSDAISEIISTLPFNAPAFMNTQLFFNPINPEQHNYWHRDPQYHLSIDGQKKALKRSEVIHFRIALENEPGLELIPGTHCRWDTKEELNVRLEQSGNKNYQSLSSSVTVPLKKGDLLVFSANMIHRGLYGGNRKALDILFCEATAELLEFARTDCLPNAESLKQLKNPSLFSNTLRFCA